MNSAQRKKARTESDLVRLGRVARERIAEAERHVEEALKRIEAAETERDLMKRHIERADQAEERVRLVHESMKAKDQQISKLSQELRDQWKIQADLTDRLGERSKRCSELEALELDASKLRDRLRKRSDEVSQLQQRVNLLMSHLKEALGEQRSEAEFHKLENILKGGTLELRR